VLVGYFGGVITFREISGIYCYHRLGVLNKFTLRSTTVVALFASDHMHKNSTVTSKDKQIISISRSTFRCQMSTVVLASTRLRTPVIDEKVYSRMRLRILDIVTFVFLVIFVVSLFMVTIVFVVEYKLPTRQHGFIAQEIKFILTTLKTSNHKAECRRRPRPD
jgi:hypothetical protein